MFAQKDFEIDEVLSKPLIAHLSTIDKNEPRNSPVWFIWEESCIWIFGKSEESFIKRLKTHPNCAIGIVDFNLEKGILKHVSIRGTTNIVEIDAKRLHRFVSKYLGKDNMKWNKWFITNIVDPLDTMLIITPKTIVTKDVSFFKTGAGLAHSHR